jgi:hypothetical protein
MDDWKRLLELEQSKGTLQYGQTLQISPKAGNADLVQVSQDLIRFVGEKTDINSWRVYLGPWQPSPRITIQDLISTVHYADPTPWAFPEPTNYDSMTSIPLYARIQWGSGGIQHNAFVDWPKRGLLLQISGSSVQVTALADTFSANANVEQLPLLQATLGPEPGGGDADNPATFTYAPEGGELFVGPPITSTRNFQIPPFARSFVPLVNLANLIDTGAAIVVSVQNFPGNFGLNNEQQTWKTPVGGVYDQNFGQDTFPISGQQSGNVRITIIGGPIGPQFGCMFLLDL